KSIENELNKWKIQIRLEQDKYNPAVQCLNKEDVEFENILNVVTLEKELIVIDLFLLIEPMICLKLFILKLFVFVYLTNYLMFTLKEGRLLFYQT
ncbi:hypothetical protein RFI_40290, partial [Reticulomyxa filosa]